MKTRQILIIAVPIAVIAISVLLNNLLSTPKERPAKAKGEDVSSVFTAVVDLESNKVFIESTGLLEAKNRVDLYSEVQGLMEADNGRFRAGNTFNKGSKLLSIQNQDRLAALVSQRSKFQSSLSAVMPDIRVDFEGEFPAWNEYLSGISVTESLASLPKTSSDNLKAFLTGRGIYSEYYSVKNAEITFDKYQIYAPFSGVLTEATVDPGTVIRPGQKLGRFIKPGDYEIECQVNVRDLNFLSVNQKVKLNSEAYPEKTWYGKIARVNSAIDPSSQMCSVIIAIQAADLKDGMFLKASIEARNLENSFSIPRSAVVDGSSVYLVSDGTLKLKKVEVLYRGENNCIIEGVSAGERVLTKVPPGAFEGLKVKVYSKKEA